MSVRFQTFVRSKMHLVLMHRNALWCSAHPGPDKTAMAHPGVECALGTSPGNFRSRLVRIYSDQQILSRKRFDEFKSLWMPLTL